MSLDPETIHAALTDANKSRAHLYLAFFRAMERRWGRAEAIAAMREAIRGWGAGLGAGMVRREADPFAGLLDQFVYVPDGGRMFQPKVGRCDAAGLDTQMMRCPLKDAWQEAGIAEDEIALLCNIAAEADYGTLEAAGFSVEIDCWQPGKAGCCAIRIRPADAAKAEAPQDSSS